MGVAHLVGLTAFSGAFVAGNHAGSEVDHTIIFRSYSGHLSGMVYDEFPTMGGKFIPDDIINPYLEV